MTTGMISYYSSLGFGLIRQGDGKEVFVHIGNVEDADKLLVGERVEFEVHLGLDGDEEACNVRFLSQGY